MLEIKNIQKEYRTGDLVQRALDDVSFNLRDNEFVAILGPSGSGKTTLLNLIGGLDRYDAGDLIINGTSTKDYTDRDWDSYRNHTIGFVFQSYNLIPHQSILSNVELALTISGISRAQRKDRAKEVLAKVGLKDHLHKRPNQLSGGQMQRVAIARALVNDPEILLADEPTGALDTDTGIQVMELLKEVAKDRLVVLVTHNQELADRYASRILRLKDGKVVDDTRPFSAEEAGDEPVHRNLGRASMSFFTALSLSFNNLRTKFGRTLLTAFAGSIGIIGIALILSLSTGVNQYVEDVQRDTMSSYPITIEERTFDLSSMLEEGRRISQEDPDHEKDAVYSDSRMIERMATMTTGLTENNLTDFKAYLDKPASEIHTYIGDNGIHYAYSPQFDVFTHDPEGTLINTDGVRLAEEESETQRMFGGPPAGTPGAQGSTLFGELLPLPGGRGISPVITDNYQMITGEWPQNAGDVLMFLDENNEISTLALYETGLLPAEDYIELMDRLDAGEEVETPQVVLDYDDVLGKTLWLLPVAESYEEHDGVYTFVGEDEEKIEERLEEAIELTITGVVRPAEDAANALFGATIGYTYQLTEEVIERTDKSEVVRAQKADPDRNVLTGLRFAPANDAQKEEDARAYIETLNLSERAALTMFLQQDRDEEESEEETEDTGSALSVQPAEEAEIPQMPPGPMPSGEEALAQQLDVLTEDPAVLRRIYDDFITPGSYEDNLKTFGVISMDAPSAIRLYTDSFEAKDGVSSAIENYNRTAEEDDRIVYNDYVGLLMSSVTTIVNVITYVLIAFVAVSLVVSSIMIGIITYISVLERTKEIGILRAIGASKRNVARVFNAETFIVGLFAGLIGVFVSRLILIPGNQLIHHLTGLDTVHARLPLAGAVILVVLSMILTLIAGLIPANKAAKQDPVTALRTE
ncbi:MAG: ATP-binding cassette domain-containing protein [Peptoniphilaceae bacterium]|jgi:putative ABC transport system permease protein